MLRLPALFLAIGIALLGSASFAEAQSAGQVSGYIIDQTGLAVADVSVSATGPFPAPAVRTTRTDRRGVYTFASVPPGTYRVAFEFEGFQRQERTVSVEAGAVVTLDIRLELASIPQEVRVTRALDARPTREAAPGEAVLSGEALDRAPIERTVEQAVLMTPGVSATRPSSGLVMAGAFSYGNLFLVDGLVANDSTRGGARGFYFSDALQEIRVATGAIPVEFGRFQGGVVQVVTRSGGNAFSGTLRLTITNDNWRALTPYRGDVTMNHRMPTWELTGGGPLVKQKLYFFGGATRIRNEQQRTLAFTGGTYPYTDDETRYEIKGTWVPAKSQTVQATYFRIDSSRDNVASGTVMDQASLYDTRWPESLAGVEYRAVLGKRVLLETRYSRRDLVVSGAGASDTSLTLGTPIWDRSRSDARFNSPTGCAVCPGAADERGSQDFTAKFLFTLRGARRAAHEIGTGVDLFQETRHTNAYQSGSGYRVRATRSTVQGGQVYPVFLADRTTWIYFQPILQPSVGNDLRTYSAYASDTWRLTRTLTVRAGLRLDVNDDHDSTGARAVLDTAWSPRVGVSWDPTGRGAWLVSGAWSRYVSAINNTVADAASPGGRPAAYVYDYLGPTVNASTTGPLTPSANALAVLFNWFLAPPGVNRATRSAPSTPGVNVRVDDALAPLDTREVMVGVNRQLGTKGSVRVEGIFRRYLNFYATRRDLTTGKVTAPGGATNDVMVITNAGSDANRTYKGLHTQVVYRPISRVQILAAYTLASTFGNVEGEDAAIGPTMVTADDYPEYREPRWNAPDGPVATDQRHRLRLWANVTLKVPPAVGSITPGVIQRIESGTPWSAIGNINPSTYVKNPGYATPPTSVAYYFSDRGAYRNETVFATDLSVYWSRRIPKAKKGQIFARALLVNVFNQSAAIRVNRTVLTRNDSTAYQAFNPFTQTPVLGTHYGYGVDFGKPISPFDYQAPREFSIAFGIRY
jgi:outer membrane receptor for ferrienterochelin and colicin